MSKKDPYLQGRYDELLERHNELKEMFRSQQWERSIERTRGTISGAQVSYYSGLQFDSTIIGISIDGAGIVFTIASYLFSLLDPIVQTLGFTISAFGFLYGLLSWIGKKREAKAAQPQIGPRA